MVSLHENIAVDTGSGGRELAVGLVDILCDLSCALDHFGAIAFDGCFHRSIFSEGTRSLRIKCATLPEFERDEMFDRRPHILVIGRAVPLKRAAQADWIWLRPGGMMGEEEAH